MKYVIVGKNMEVSPSLEKSVKDKLQILALKETSM